MKAGEDIGSGQTGYGAGEATGLIGSVLGPEAVKAGVKGLRPTTATIAGEQIPVRASQESGVASAAEKVSRTKPLQQFDIEQTQPAARRAIGNLATDVKNTAGERAPALDAQSALNKLRAAGTKAVDLGDAAEKVRDYARPVFDKLDELTKNDPQTFSDLQQQERAALRGNDFEAAQRARHAQKYRKCAENFQALVDYLANEHLGLSLDDQDDADELGRSVRSSMWELIRPFTSWWIGCCGSTGRKAIQKFQDSIAFCQAQDQSNKAPYPSIRFPSVDASRVSHGLCALRRV